MTKKDCLAAKRPRTSERHRRDTPAVATNVRAGSSRIPFADAAGSKEQANG